MEAVAAPEVTEVLLTEIVLDRRFQARRDIDFQTVKEYAELLRSGADFPPLEGMLIGGVVYLIEGWHRHNALSSIGRETAAIIIRPGTIAKAKAAAAASNRTHGLRRKKEDVALVIRLALEAIADMDEDEWAAWRLEKQARADKYDIYTDGWTQGDIADVTGYSRGTVGKYRELTINDMQPHMSLLLLGREARVSVTQRDVWEIRRDVIEESPEDLEPVGLYHPPLVRIADQDTGKPIAVIHDDGDVAAQAHEMTKNIVNEALKNTSRARALTHAENQAAIKCIQFFQFRFALKDLLVITPEEMIEHWELNNEGEDLAGLVDDMIARLSLWSAAIKAAERPRLRAVK